MAMSHHLYKKIPRIRQAGSAEAFLDSTATGREHFYHRHLLKQMQHIYCISFFLCLSAPLTSKPF